MKRTGIQRKTPMQRGDGPGLEPGGPLKRATPLKAGGNPLARRGRKAVAVPVAAKATTVPKSKRQRETGPSKDVKDLLREKRAKGKCERCEHGGRLDVHHRRARKMGGTIRPEINSPENLLVLCRPCHHSITDTNGRRADYEFEGLLIREDRRDPADVKVLLAGGWFFLNNLGGKTPTTAPEKTSC